MMAPARRSRPKAPVAEQKPLEIDGIPTAHGLVKMGREYAEIVPKGIHITAKGHALLGEKLREKAQQDRAKGIWHGVSGPHAGGPVPQAGIRPGNDR